MLVEAPGTSRSSVRAITPPLQPRLRPQRSPHLAVIFELGSESSVFKREVGKGLRDEDDAGPSHSGQPVRTLLFVIEMASKTRMTPSIALLNSSRTRIQGLMRMS